MPTVEKRNDIICQSVGVILSRLIGESSKEGEEDGEDDGEGEGEEADGDDDESADEETDGGDEARSEVSASFLLLILPPPSLSWLPALTSLVVM